MATTSVVAVNERKRNTRRSFILAFLDITFHQFRRSETRKLKTKKSWNEGYLISRTYGENCYTYDPAYIIFFFSVFLLQRFHSCGIVSFFILLFVSCFFFFGKRKITMLRFSRFFFSLLFYLLFFIRMTSPHSLAFVARCVFSFFISFFVSRSTLCFLCKSQQKMFMLFKFFLFVPFASNTFATF